MHEEKVLNELYQQAIALKKLKPWSFMLEDQVFGIINPRTQQMAYCSITGSMGQDLALTVYLGDASFQHIYKVLTEEEHMASIIQADHILSVSALKCSFEDKEHLYPEEEERLKSLGLRFRGENAWPACRSLEPGKLPKMLVDEEACLFLTEVLEQTILLMKQVKKQEVTIEPIQRANQILCLVPSETETGAFDIVYKDFKLKPQMSMAPYIYNNELELRKLTGLKTKSLSLECATVLLPVPVGEGESRSLPTLMMAMNPREGHIFFADVASEENVNKGFEGRGPVLLDHFIQSMLENKIKPRYITVNKEEDYLLLEDFCKKARIDLKKHTLSHDFYEALEEITYSFVQDTLLDELDDEWDEDFDEDEDFTLEELKDEMEAFFLKEIKAFIEYTTEQILTSKIVKAYTTDEKDTLVMVIEMFVQVAYDVYDMMPGQWNKQTVESMFKEAIPAYVTIPYEELEQVPRMLRDFFAFLGQEQLIENSAALIQAVKKNEAILLKNARDTSRWTPGKTEDMRMLEEGMDS